MNGMPPARLVCALEVTLWGTLGLFWMPVRKDAVSAEMRIAPARAVPIRIIGGGDPEPLRRAALRNLATAADRAMGLDLAHAVGLAREALEIATTEDRERAPLLCVLGTSHVLAGEYDQARSALGDARAAAEATGDMESLGQAYFGESELEFFGGTSDAYSAVLIEAVDRLSRERRAVRSHWCSQMLPTRP